jgi:hypothetical protein
MSEYENTNDDLDFTVEDLTEDLDTTKVEDLAEELGIEATISVEEESQDNNVISSDLPDEKVKKVSAIGEVNGAIGSTTAERKKAPKKSSKKVAEPADEKVAVFSTKNVTWPEVGKVYRGYNIVSKDAAEKWATRSHIRIATPEEFAEEFGN